MGVLLNEATDTSGRESPPQILVSLGSRFSLRPEDISVLQRAAGEATAEEWAAAEDEAIYRRVGGLLCHHLRNAGIAEPAASLQHEYRRTALANATFEAELRRLAPSLAEGGVSPLLIKGFALQEIYGNMGLRPMEDSDWVLRTSVEVESVLRVLEEQGYETADAVHWERGPFRIEIHQRVCADDRVSSRYEGGGNEQDVEVWSRSRPSPLGAPYRIPSPEDHLLILSAHLMKHNFSPGIWYADIEAVILSESRFDWEAVLTRAAAWKLLRPLSYTVQMMTRGDSQGRAGLLSCFPAHVLAELERIQPGWLDRVLLELAASGKRLEGEKDEWEEPPVANLLWISNQKGLGGKGRLLWEAAFPRAEIMAQMYPAYRPGLRWWYILLRAADLLRLGARVGFRLLISSHPPA
ncbi:MAG: nucleotidyltransferase family protein [bacterium]|nr:nucleotidyltransferase family protein [bacterium]